MSSILWKRFWRVLLAGLAFLWVYSWIMKWVMRDDPYSSDIFRLRGLDWIILMDIFASLTIILATALFAHWLASKLRRDRIRILLAVSFTLLVFSWLIWHLAKIQASVLVATLMINLMIVFATLTVVLFAALAIGWLTAKVRRHPTRDESDGEALAEYRRDDAGRP